MAITVRQFVPQRRWLRWLLVAMLALLAAIALGEAIGWPFLRAPLQRTLAEKLGRPVEIGADFKLRLIGSVRLRSDALLLGSPPDAPVVHDREGRPQRFVDARGVTLVLPYATVSDLMRGVRPLRVRSLDVTRLELGLARNPDGRSNWQVAAVTPSGGAAPLPQFDRLVVHAGRMRLDDARNRLVVDATLQTREGSSAGGEPRGLELNAVGRWRDSPLRAQFRSSGVLPLAAAIDGDRANTVPLHLELRAGETELLLDGRGGDLLNLSALDAQIQLKGPSLAAVGMATGITLPSTAPFTLRGQLRKAGAVWNANIESLAIGSTRLQGEFAYDPQPAVPMLSGRLAGARLALLDLGAAFGAGANARQPDRTPDRVLPQAEFALPALAAMNADLTLRLDQVALGTPNLDNLAPLHGRLSLRDRVLSVGDLMARSAGGELRGALSLDARAKLPKWQADLRWSGVRLERFVKARNPAAEDSKGGAAQSYISGVLGGRAKLTGSGRSTAALLGSLDGTTELWVRDGRVSSLLTELAGIDLAESLGVAISGDDGLPMRCAVARLVLKDGVMTPEVALIDTTDSTITGAGRISLADERLQLVLTTRPHDVTPLSLRSPVKIEGTFAKPVVNLDASQMGLRIAAAAALAAITPLAGLLALADFGEPERAVCGEALKRLQSPAAPNQAAPKKTPR